MPRPRRVTVIVVGSLCAGVVAASAPGHVMISPPFAEAGVEAEIGFTVPNERRGHVTTSVSVEAPAGVTMKLGPPIPPGWSASVEDGRRVTWSGGRIAGESLVRFVANVTARTDPGQVIFRATQRYEDGRSVPWEVDMTVVPGPEAPPQHLRRALTAAGVGLVVIAASLLALRRLRKRSSLQER